MYYFKFVIPKGLGYSPGWHGVMDRCPKDVTVDLYNDRDGYGVAHTEDKFVPKEVTVVTGKEVDRLLAQSINQFSADTIWKPIFFRTGLIPEDAEYSTHLIRNRWSEEVKKLGVAASENTMAADVNKPTLVDSKGVCCPVCHKLVAGVNFFDNGSLTIIQSGRVVMQNIVCKALNLTCPDGHKLEVTGNG